MKLPSKSRSKQAQRLVDLNHETVWMHIPDGAKDADLDLADASCRHCSGTGIAGQLVVTHGKPAVKERKEEPLYERVQLTCACVVRREVEKAEATEAARLAKEEAEAANDDPDKVLTNPLKECRDFSKDDMG